MPRFIKLDKTGNVLNDQSVGFQQQSWSCVRDRLTGLTWEIKTNQQSLRYRHHTYSWFSADSTGNGGFQGYLDLGACPLDQCNTQSYISALNQYRLCNAANWRLPTREELRSIVDYSVTYPGPTVDIRYFPDTVAQFYWSSTTDADDKNSAWGIGFAFGYDYAYGKDTAARVRLVYSAG